MSEVTRKSLFQMVSVLAWLYRPVAVGLQWVGAKVHRLASAAFVAAIAGVEGMMHIFSMPHPEGWWLPIMSGGAAATASFWLSKWKKRMPETSTVEKL